MNNTCTNNSKCPKNLGIVVECAENGEENQALLRTENERVEISTKKSKQQSANDGKNNANSSKSQEDALVVTEYLDGDEHLTSSGMGKAKKRNQQQSRVERSRLSVITFLNNITASSASGSTNSSKSNRSQSISSPSNPKLRQEKQQNTTHKTSKSLGGKIAENNLPFDAQEALSIGEILLTSDATTETGKEVEIDMTASCPAPADKLSIKSGVSMAASSTSGPSESLFSAGSGSGHSGNNLSSSKAPKHRECPICCVRQQSANFQRLKCCTHLACKTCLIKYLNCEIMASRTSIACPECPAQLLACDIYTLLAQQPELLERFELFSLRRALITDPDTRWCPAPDCIYAVIAQSCAACPQLKCERCETMFCYHCKSYWHPSQTCDQARAKSLFSTPTMVQTIRTSVATEMDSDVMKACPRCGALIMKMNDGSCNHMQCALCNAEFCWLCLKQINELHYLSPTGCTFWGKKPWTRKKKLLWQIGTLIGAPLGIALIAGLAIPGIICGVPIFVGRKTYQRFSNLTRTKRQLVTALSVFGSLIVSPVLAVMTVGVGVPIMLAYVYGVVPLSLCRNGACAGTTSNGANGDEDEVAYGEEIMVTTTAETGRNGPGRQQEEKTSKASFHHRRQSIASSGLVSLTDKPNTEDASIQAIAGSQYNYDNRSVWSNGQCGGHVSAMEGGQEATNYNNEDAENASTLACCSASIVAQASERRSLTGSSGSFKTRPRSSISNSRGASEEPGRHPSKFIRKHSRNNADGAKTINNVETSDRQRKVTNNSSLSCHISPASSTNAYTNQPNISAESGESGSTGSAAGKYSRRISFRSFIRHPFNTLMARKKGSGDANVINA